MLLTILFPLISNASIGGTLGALSALGINSLHSFVLQYGYLAIFILMALEAASLPIAPNEVLLPVAGYYISQGLFTFPAVFAVVLVAGTIGMGADYFIAYYLSKDVVYKHLRLFHVKRETLDSFDKWFQRNGSFAVFSLRMVPIVRGLISFPAGFAAMPKKKFFFYSTAGSVIWYVLLIGFGYYALGSNSVTLALAMMAALGVILYVVYLAAMRATRRQ